MMEKHFIVFLVATQIFLGVSTCKRRQSPWVYRKELSSNTSQTLSKKGINKLKIELKWRMWVAWIYFLVTYFCQKFLFSRANEYSNSNNLCQSRLCTRVDKKKSRRNSNCHDKNLATFLSHWFGSWFWCKTFYLL